MQPRVRAFRKLSRSASSLFFQWCYVSMSTCPSPRRTCAVITHLQCLTDYIMRWQDRPKILLFFLLLETPLLTAGIINSGAASSSTTTTTTTITTHYVPHTAAASTSSRSRRSRSTVCINGRQNFHFLLPTRLFSSEPYIGWARTALTLPFFVYTHTRARAGVRTHARTHARTHPHSVVMGGRRGKASAHAQEGARSHTAEKSSAVAENRGPPQYVEVRECDGEAKRPEREASFSSASPCSLKSTRLPLPFTAFTRTTYSSCV